MHPLFLGLIYASYAKYASRVNYVTLGRPSPGRKHRPAPSSSTSAAPDERRLRLDPASRRQPQRPRALFHSLLLRPEPRGRGQPSSPPASRRASPSAIRPSLRRLSHAQAGREQAQSVSRACAWRDVRRSRRLSRWAFHACRGAPTPGCRARAKRLREAPGWIGRQMAAIDPLRAFPISLVRAENIRKRP